MSRQTRIFLIIGVIVLALVAGVAGLSAYYADLPENLSQHETQLLGQSRLVPGSQAAMRVLVRDSADGAPLADADIEVRLQPAGGGRAELVYTGATDAAGTADVSFDVPDSGENSYTLIVDTRSRLGDDRMERPLTLERDYRILLSTDKPLYQPGQVIHLRALALSTFDLAPAAAQPLAVSIADGKGNTVFRDTLTTSDFGVGFVDFQLASEVNTGPYKIQARLGNTVSEQTVTVERYVLPQFDVQIETEKPYYRPGETVRGTLTAVYFFGKPVAASEVALEGFTFDFERQDVFALQGTTDAQGSYSFEFALPDFIVGSDLESGLGTFYLQAAVTDQTNHTESKGRTLPVAQNSLIVEAIPEGGVFRPGVENLLYVLTSYPDGTPAEARLRVDFLNSGTAVSAETGPYGLAAVPVTPDAPWQEIAVTATDALGNEVRHEFFFDGEYFEESILLRPDRPAYRVGETMNLNLITSAQSGTVYLDIVREGQTVSTRAVPVTDGQAAVAVDLTPALFGTLELHAYKVLRSGSIVRDTRLVIVDEADDLSVAFAADKDEYRPGETAVLDVTTSGADGQGAQAAIGLAVVDEAVFALAEQDPGFAKLYFLLEQELLQPKYELHGFSVPDLLLEEAPAADPLLRTAQEGAAQASLSEATPRGDAFSLNANSREENMARAYTRREAYFGDLTQVLFGLLLIVPLGVVGVTAVHLWREQRFWRSLAVAVGVVVAFVLLGFTGLLEAFFDWLSWEGEWVIWIMLIAGLISYVGLAVLAWRRRDRALGWAVGLVLLFGLLLVATTWAAQWGNPDVDDGVLLFAVIVVLLLPLAFLLRAAGFGMAQRRLPAAAAALVALLLMVVPVLGIGASMGGAMSQVTRGLDDGGMMVMEEAAMEMADMAVPMAAEADFDEAANTAAQAEGGEAPRLRQFFPETMFWLPDGVTGADGVLTVDVPVADSITTWRLTALASTQDGRLGSATGALRVFQPFFVNLDLPQALTVGDEIAVPVGVFNYLPTAQTVRLTVEPQSWFELQDEAAKEIVIESNDISVVYFRIRALAFGVQPFEVTAIGSEQSDAIRKQVRVFPDGKEIRFSESDALAANATTQQRVSVPADAIAGTQQLTVKIYPGMVSQVVEGLDSILQMPNGCFEQTSSTTYPNVLVLDYLQNSGQISPEVQLKAEEYINLGYQRLTTFEVPGGGFSLFGDHPAVVLLSAYGVQEFGDMNRVFDVDEALIARTAEWLLQQQNGDGSWGSEGWVEGTFVSGPESDPTITTAYVVWSLARAGYGGDGRVQTGLSWLLQKQGSVDDPYALALIANAFVAADAVQQGQEVLNRLAGMAQLDGDTAFWGADSGTFMGSYGEAGNLETTALATLAFIYSGGYTDLANKGLLYLIQNKDSFGNWQTTQATILSLQAFIASARLGSQQTNATVTITLNGGQTRQVTVTPDNFDVVQLVTFDDVPLGEAEVEMAVQGEGSLMYQVAGSYYLPWDKLVDYPEVVEGQDLVNIDVRYDRAALRVDETVTVDVTVSMAEGRADWALVDLGIPPGFSVNAEDLSALVAQFENVGPGYAGATVERYELTGRQILVYLGNVSAEEPLRFSYRLTAKFPLRAQTPASSAYDYYNPGVSGEEAPQVLTVEG
ncbi:MAG: hypothetical protein KC425_12175 [Anaerolineales bacterium]|nr:hypothetical protein [Anaerolineales bacterium]